MSDSVKLIVPSAINLLTAVNESYLTLNKKGEELSIALPSLRRRATLVIKEKGVLPIQDFTVPDDSFVR